MNSDSQDEVSVRSGNPKQFQVAPQVLLTFGSSEQETRGPTELMVWSVAELLDWALEVELEVEQLGLEQLAPELI